MKNNNIAVFGGQRGDEGKARVVHYLAPAYDYIVRFSGSGNAGHTIYHNGRKIVRHLIPSADFSIGNKAFLGAGMVIHLEDLLKEVQETEEMFPGAASNIIVDPDAFVVFKAHIEEDKEKNKHIGSTNKGVTPAYRDKIGRVGTKISKLLQDKSEITTALQKMGVQFKHLLELKEVMEKSRLLFEGSQSIQLDLNFGSYPFVTSGDCGLGGIYNAGFAFAAPTRVYGIAKCYLTKAGGGDGPFITELPEEEAAPIRDRGGEVGATTGRPRRIGALDLPALKYSIIKGGITDLVLTKLDIFNGLEKVKACYNYDKPVYSGADLDNAKPLQYVEFQGWQDAGKLEQIMPFVSAVETYCKTPVSYVSVGTENKDMISLQQESSNDRFIDPFDTSSIDKAFLEAGFPTLSEVMSDKIKKRIIK